MRFQKVNREWRWTEVNHAPLAVRSLENRIALVRLLCEVWQVRSHFRSHLQYRLRLKLSHLEHVYFVGVDREGTVSG